MNAISKLGLSALIVLLAGCKLSGTATNIEQNILPGLKLFLEFVLDDAKQSIVKKEVVVKAKNGKAGRVVTATVSDAPRHLRPAPQGRRA